MGRRTDVSEYGTKYWENPEWKKKYLGNPTSYAVAPTANGQYQSPDYADNWQDYLEQVPRNDYQRGQILPITAESTEWDKAYNAWSRGQAEHPGLMRTTKWEMENYGRVGPAHSGGATTPWNKGQPIDSLDRYKQDMDAWKSAWRPGGSPTSSPTESPTAPTTGQTTAPPPNTGGAAQPWDEGVQSIWDDPRSAWLEEQEMGGFNAADYRTGGKLNTPEEFAKLTRAQQEIVQRPENTFQQAGPGGATDPGGTAATGGTPPPPNPSGPGPSGFAIPSGGFEPNPDLRNQPPYTGPKSFSGEGLLSGLRIDYPPGHYSLSGGRRGPPYPIDGGTKRPPCFVAGTKVAVSNKGTKNIEDVEVGDLVVCYDTTSNTLEESAVTHTFTHPDTDGYLVVNESLGVTPNHEIYTGTGWVSAGNLEVGDNIQMIGGGLTKVSNIEKVDKSVTTHNLEVANRHNYYADGVLVHNKQIIKPREPRDGGGRGPGVPNLSAQISFANLQAYQNQPGTHPKPTYQNQPGTQRPPPNPMGGRRGGQSPPPFPGAYFR